MAALGGSSGALTQEAALVANDDHEVKVVRVELTGTLHGGIVQPPSAEEAFLLVYLETDDPCFDYERNRFRWRGVGQDCRRNICVSHPRSNLHVLDAGTFTAWCDVWGGEEVVREFMARIQQARYDTAI